MADPLLGELGVLRAARQAIDEGLISTQDYDVVKVAFLRAQQIKAGLDAGFIRQDDYVLARDAYLNALDLSVLAVPSSGAATPAGGGTGGGFGVGLSANGARNSGSGSGSVRGDAFGSGGGQAPGGSMDGGGGGGGRGWRASGAATDLAAVLADVPQYAAKGVTNGKCSMAGIGLAEECVNLFMHMKQRSAFKWMTFKVDDSGKTVIPDRVGGKGSSYEDFVATLPEHECRYGVYDYEYISPERGGFSKLVFINWAPETAHIKTKMMYAATKDFFKGFLDGIGAELQASEFSEVSEDEVHAKVVANLSRK
ncbi:Actin-depolymerizing factor 6 [Monoraphidium neglectum]|uniref:Actin-depolymerizing factor 6 n=1 Tax=Monoraphidium neglectum TaxID=145388 RepID=A0A0D2KNX8_9CHLO|nr:Actin-depolymerizing factor 6 [Monoraphidium neglectum]KIY97358.1 Actin-depolymerizing factor 6 [Monoraphidium neglectum]|eukprot:XP_013896378.1 Actin-depolymerizing factor 6 [Monoraphidium neglectum]